MSITEPSFTIGVEEEYLLVDQQSRDLVNDPPAALIQRCTELCRGQVSPELMRSQIEVGTRVCANISEVRKELQHLRGVVSQVANEHGLAPIAVSTHPFAKWLMQKQTDKDRYQALTRELQGAARRLLICGMHIHVGIEDQEMRIDLMNQMSYFLPHLLALSCSSPFWEGEETGLRSYRLTVFDSLPRTGLPEQFASYSEYQRHVDVLVQAGILEDATKIWWDLRPNFNYPTLETRVTDICTNLEDTVCLAALNVSILRMLYRLRSDNQRWRVYASMLIRENRWRAMRYSFNEGLIDLAKAAVVPYDELLEEIIELTREDAEVLDCVDEVTHAKTILSRGTSSHNQLAVFQDAVDGGADRQEALIQVVDWLMAETVEGL
jgi:carboxylate-amine ligase